MRWSLGWPRSNISHGIPNRLVAADLARLPDSCGSSRAPGASTPNEGCYREAMKSRIIAGRSQLRLATFLLPTHREVVAAAFGFPL
jgi:hypothetical protein